MTRAPSTMRRTLTLFATLLVLWALLAQANHALTGFRIYLFAAKATNSAPAKR